MKDLIWDDSLSIQIREIDEDHHKLVDLFNMLNHALAEGENPDYIEAIIEELITCTAWHFKHEERLMMKYGYEGLEEHRKEHQELVNSALELKQKFLAQSKTLSDRDIEFMEHWLTGHIYGSDMEMGSYLCEVM
ncbi:MAG: hypothetical protein EP315_02550 [Gammaproteobacteria bacterium]|nr:MAG: hypothetical protein EP315_02550 [Gammaproteobacteria bacterium]